MNKPLKKTVTSAALALAALPLSALALAAPAHADDGTMPNVSGRGLVSAYQALNYSTHVQLKDGRGTGRHVLWPGSWKVCDQQPAPGARLEHQKITLTVVKTKEQCGTRTAG
ncbi:PASTA domain-containing protein [Streptomyces albospinus]|uniref:PASTA domain-containing protein n=1 Tax=Streptomyces albospinus TaxID=285515 RepID=UPI001E5271B4|nr:PASTA domain-containing protein [Streptomyces albospinus]